MCTFGPRFKSPCLHNTLSWNLLQSEFRYYYFLKLYEHVYTLQLVIEHRGRYHQRTQTRYLFSWTLLIFLESIQMREQGLIGIHKCLSPKLQEIQKNVQLLLFLLPLLLFWLQVVVMRHYFCVELVQV